MDNSENQMASWRYIDKCYAKNSEYETYWIILVKVI